MKVLHIVNFYYPHIGGIEQTARDCVNSLKDKHENKVICFNGINSDSIDQIDGIEIIRCRENVKLFSQSLSTSYPQIIKKTIQTYNPDIIIFYYPNPFEAYFLLKLIPEKCKFVLYWHLDITKQKHLGKLFYKQNEKLLQRANIIIATSVNYIEGSRWLSKYKDKCYVVNSCINEKRLEINSSIKSLSKTIREENKDKTICLAFGRHVEYKGFEYLIKASKYLDNSFRIFIIGEGKLTKKLKEEAKNDLKIVFLGKVSDDVLKAHLLAMDILCFPSISKNEAFGLALAEGMYFGKPAVTFTINGSGVNYVNVNGETGIEVENKNYIEYAKALQKLSNDSGLRKRLGDNARNRVKNKLTYTEYSKNMLKAINEVVNIM